MSRDRPAPTRVYFDSQQLNYFVDAANSHPPGALREVRRAQDRGRIEVVGSLDLLQEVIEAQRANPQKSARMVDTFFQLVGSRVLLPLSERHPAEAIEGGLLPEPTRYLPPDLRREVRSAAQSGDDRSEIASMLLVSKDEFIEDERRAQLAMRQDLEAAGLRKRGAAMNEWIRDVKIDDWVLEVVRSGQDRGRIPKEASASGAGLPSASAFVLIKLARLVRTLGEGRRIAPSDLADAHHAASGPYFDVLVTDDRELSTTMSLVAARLPFNWMTSSEFFARLIGQN